MAASGNSETNFWFAFLIDRYSRCEVAEKLPPSLQKLLHGSAHRFSDGLRDRCHKGSLVVRWPKIDIGREGSLLRQAGQDALNERGFAKTPFRENEQFLSIANRFG